MKRPTQAMNLFETIKQFRNILPDPGFTEKSKRMILATPQQEERSMGMRGVLIFLHTIETGAALALVGFFILLVTGSFSGTKYLAPVQYSVIDPGGLHAEADAIDMQIQLANISYAEVSSTAAESTTAMIGGTGMAGHSLTVKDTTPSAALGTGTADIGIGAASSTGSSTLSVNQALEQLSQ
jgi:hypothetical protein